MKKLIIFLCFSLAVPALFADWGAQTGAWNTSPTSSGSGSGSGTVSSGSTGYVPKYTGATTVGQGSIYDDGTNIGIGNALPTRALDVTGSTLISSTLSVTGSGLSGTSRVFAVPNSSFTVMANGNVGIGTYSPGSPLEVVGNVNFSSIVDLFLTAPAANPARITMTGSGDTASAFTYKHYSNTSSIYPIFGFYRASGTVASPSNVIDTMPMGELIWTGLGGTGPAFRTGASLLGTVDGAPGASYTPGMLQIKTTNTSGATAARLTVRQDGNVGIGTTAPVSALDVSGDLYVNNVYSRGSGSFVFETTTTDINFIVAGTTQAKINTSSFTVVGPSFYVATASLTVVGGNVGIGTTAPTSKLVISSGSLLMQGSGSNITQRDSNSGNRIGRTLNNIANSGVNDRVGDSYELGAPGAERAYWYLMGTTYEWRLNTDGFYTWLLGATEKMRLTAGGNLGLGTTNPLYRLQISSGNILLDGSAPTLSIAASTGTPATNSLYSILYSSNTSGTIEGWWKDGAGNSTQQTPHIPGTDVAWFNSMNSETGRSTHIYTEDVVRTLEELTGKTLHEVWYFGIQVDQKTDDKLRAMRPQIQAAFKRLKTDEKKRKYVEGLIRSFK